MRTQSFCGPLGSRRPHSTPAPPSGPGWLLPEWEARQSLSTLCREQTRGLQGLAVRAWVTRSAWGPQVLLNTTPTRPTALPGTLGQAWEQGASAKPGPSVTWHQPPPKRRQPSSITSDLPPHFPGPGCPLHPAPLSRRPMPPTRETKPLTGGDSHRRGEPGSFSPWRVGSSRGASPGS